MIGRRFYRQDILTTRRVPEPSHARISPEQPAKTFLGHDVEPLVGGKFLDGGVIRESFQADRGKHPDQLDRCRVRGANWLGAEYNQCGESEPETQQATLADVSPFHRYLIGRSGSGTVLSERMANNE